MSTPRVSVIIATYNWSAVLKYSIASVLAQTLTDFELLVVGDACTDDTEEVVGSFADPRVTWTNLSSRVGSQSGPNNEGLRRAKGEFVAYLGHDDVWLPEHLERLVAAIDRESADFVFSLVSLSDPDGTHRLSGLLPGETWGENSFCVPSGMLHRRSVVDVIGGWPAPEQTRQPVDVHWQQDAWRAGLRLVGISELTAVKFAASVRPNSYVDRRADEQAALAKEISATSRFGHHALVDLLASATRGEMARVRVERSEFHPPGWWHRQALRRRGLLPPAVPMKPLPTKVRGGQLPIELIDVPDRVEAGATFTAQYRLSNNSGHVLSSQRPNPVHVSYYWWDNRGNRLPVEGVRTALDSLAPREERAEFLEVLCPSLAGYYELRIALVQEQVRWFDEIRPGDRRTAWVMVEPPSA